MVGSSPFCRVLCALVLLGTLACTDPSWAGPNFIIVVTDDQRADDLVAMPTVAAMLPTSVRFTNTFVTTPICAPSRASLLTGRYAHDHGVRTLDGSRLVGEDSETLATSLQKERYRTAMVGKYLNGYLGQGPPYRSTWYVPPGWDVWRALRGEAYYDYTIVDEHGRETAHGSAPADYSTDVLRELALSFIRESLAAGTPFLLYFAPYAPHMAWPLLVAIPAPRHTGLLFDTPPLRPPSFMEADVSDKPMQNYPWWLTPDFIDQNRITRLESILAVDEALAAFLSTIAATGADRQTVIVFTSDNGFLLGEHRLFGKQAPYEEAHRVPLVIRDPLHVVSARTDDHLVLGEDIAPTLADLAHAAMSRVDGRSLEPLLRQRRVPWRTVLPLELWSVPDGSMQYRGVRTRRWSYTERAAGDEELYDLAQDPYQLENLARDPGRVAQLTRLRRLTSALHAGD